MANFAWSGFLRPLDEFVTLDLYKDLLPSIIAQGTYPPDGKLYCIGTFDSGLALWGNKEYLEKAGVRIPTSVENAWDKAEFEDALRKLAALPEVEWPLDLKLNYGPGEWFTYGFSPMIQSFGGDLIDRNTWKAEGTLDSPESVAAMQMMQSWVQNGWVVPESAGDDAFYGTKKAALAYVGHWMWPVHHQNLGDKLVLIPMPKFGPRHVSAMGSWCWGISAITPEHIQAAWQFLKFLLRPDQIVRMTNTNGAPPARFSASSLSLLHGPGKPLNIYIEQLAKIAVPRPTHPAYPVITVAFKDAVKNILAGADAKAELTAAAAKIDQDIKDNDCYPPFTSSLCP
jgi:multiple sugar transport system substrate-binding protein